MTQNDVAVAIDKKRSDIASYETKNTSPHIDTISKMADLFHVSIDYLTGRTDDPDQIFTGNDEMSPEQKHVFFRLTELMKNDLPEEDLESAIAYFEFLKTRNAGRIK